MLPSPTALSLPFELYLDGPPPPGELLGNEVVHARVPWGSVREPQHLPTTCWLQSPIPRLPSSWQLFP